MRVGILSFTLLMLLMSRTPFVFAEDEPITLNLAHGGSVDHQYQIAAEKFASLVREKTGGKIQIKIFPNGELGSEGTAGEGVCLGLIDVAVIASSGMLMTFPPFMDQS